MVEAVADALAELKALKISQGDPAALVIGSDSVVSVGGRLFDKPVSRDNAAEHLRAFSGQTMLLTSAVVRTFAWVVILGRQGIVNNTLLGLGWLAALGVAVAALSRRRRA